MFLDQVSTGSGSDLGNDQYVHFLRILTLMVEQVATAPCTDPIQVRVNYCVATARRLAFFKLLDPISSSALPLSNSRARSAWASISTNVSRRASGCWTTMPESVFNNSSRRVIVVCIKRSALYSSISCIPCPPSQALNTKSKTAIGFSTGSVLIVSDLTSTEVVGVFCRTKET